MRKIRIFVASPGEVSEERDIATYVVTELSRTLGDFLKIELAPVRWETHAWPDVGADGQDVINNEIHDYDIFVGVMWRRFGSPTKRAESGTAEEFRRAFRLYKKEKKPKIMFYFCKRPFYSPRKEELEQFSKVVAFRASIEKLGVLYWEYDTVLDFERRLREHLIRQLLEMGKPAEEAVAKAVAKIVPQKQNQKPIELSVFLSYVHEDRERVRAIANVLKLTGLNVWLDEDQLLPGQNLANEINQAILRADAMLVFISRNTRESRGFFYQELKAMYQHERKNRKQGARIIVVRLDTGIIPPGDLRRLQWVDVFSRESVPLLVKAIIERPGTEGR